MMHDRLARAMYERQERECIEREQKNRTQHEERHGFLQVPLEARQISAVLEDREDEKESSHDGENDGYRVGEPHRDEAVGANQQAREERETKGIERGVERAVDEAEQAIFEKIDGGACTEDADD